ncbi:MAG: hypothetical protein WBA93_13795 [Microcoleaceae cyanobacterium]
MTTAVRNINPQVLEDKLQTIWQSLHDSNDACKIQCNLKAGTLLVIYEHPANVVIDREKTIGKLKSIVQKQQLESIDKVGICLNLEGHIYPYSYHSFFTKGRLEESRLTFMPKWVDGNIEDSEINITPALLESLDNPFDLEDLEEISQKLELESKENNYSENSEAEAKYLPGEKGENSEINITPKLLDDLDNPFDAEDLDLAPKSFPKNRENSGSKQISHESESNIKLSTFSQVELLSASLSLAILLGCFYAITRPCVIGKCMIIPTARELNEQSLTKIKNVKNSLAPKEAQEKLEAASADLEKIPFWSIRYFEAQHLNSNYQTDIQHLETIRKALAKGQQAAQNSKGLPLPAGDWVEIQSLWQEAIALLETVPEDSNSYPFAKNKLQQYRKYLVAIKGRLTTEEEATQKLIAAKKLAQLAETREIIAQFAESWENVYANWEDAWEKVASIPPQTSAYLEAKNLIPQYEQKMRVAEERIILEQIGEEAYNRAITDAKQAEVFENRDNWKEAAEYWQRAVKSAEEVPTNSAYAAKAKPLIKSYDTALKAAESNQNLLSTLTKARQDLSKTCKGNPKICEYSVTYDLITVRLTDDYLDKIKKTAKEVKGNKDDKSRTQLEKHLKTLQVALEAISNNAKIPLEVYNPEGLKIAAHVPNS